MITDGKAQQRCQKWHYLAVKNLSRLFIGITSNHNGDFYCLNCFIHTAQKKDLKDMKEYVMIMIIVTQKFLTKTTKHQNTTTEKNH